MTTSPHSRSPVSGEAITWTPTQGYHVPDQPIIPFIQGDGTGPDIWQASQPVFDAAVAKAYGGKRRIAWMEILAGERALESSGTLLPDESLQALKQYRISIKGPLSTPTGGGHRSLNVTLRQVFDLYACIRPIRYFSGVVAPVAHPERVDMVVFRENTEDVYAGIEYQAGSPQAQALERFLVSELGAKFRPGSALGIKPISEVGSKRLIKAAIDYALAHKKPSVTLVHKGNIQKFTEGAFAAWGYDLASKEYPDQVITEKCVLDRFGGKAPAGKVVLKDRIADAMFQQALLRPDEYSVLATTNLNGDYLSDALIAQVGGLGLGPGANVGDGIAIFEATHGTAPKYAGLDQVNPGSVILSGCMMFELMGWTEAAALIVKGLEATIQQKRVTYDLERLMTGATRVKCSEFGQAIIANFGGKA